MLKSFIWPGFILLVLAQWFVPLQMIWQKEKVLTRGTSYKFETAPVDPSDPFLGKYIVLSFKENSLKMVGAEKLSYRSKVYVSFLSGINGFAKIATIELSKPRRTDYLETTINYISQEKDSVTIFLNYPFSKYYMEEYKAPGAERIYRESRADTSLKTYAIVNIHNGDAIIKDVYINDTLINDVIRARGLTR